MSWLKKITFRLQPLFRKGKIEAELADELRTHLELATEANIATGMTPENARYAAQREFGGLEQIKEAWRDERGLTWVAHLRQDLRFGARLLLRHPGWTAFIVLSLGLGIGVNVVVFSLINAFVFRPLPGVSEPGRLVHLRFDRTIPYPEFEYARDRQQTFSGLAASARVREDVALLVPGEYSAGGSARPEQLRSVQLVSANYFSVLGASVALGRTFQPADEQAPGFRPVVILNHSYWQARFNSDPAIVGRTIFLNRLPFTVVGVTRETPPLEPGMFFAPSAWIPMVMAEEIEPAHDRLQASEGGPGVGLFGRVKPGITLAQAESELKVLDAQFAREFLTPDPQRQSWTATLEHGFAFLPLNLPRLKGVIWGILALAGIVIVVACANVASLLLARAGARQREIGVRLAMGAGRGRIIRQLLTESVMLACLGGALAAIVGAWSARAVWPMALRFNPTPELLHLFDLDWHVAAYAFVAALVAGVVFGLVPALEASRLNIRSGLQREHAVGGSSGSRTRWRTILISGQFAVAVTFLILAVLAVRMISKNTALALPFDPGRISFFELSAPRGSDAARFPVDFQRALLDQVRALPNVESASVGDVWYGRALDSATLRIDGRSVPAPAGLNQSRVTPDYFETLGLSFLRGRNFTAAEAGSGAPVLIVSESFARRFWPGEDPVGRQVRIARSGVQSIMVRQGQRETNRDVEGVVVGVVQEGVRAVRNRHEYRPLAGDLYSPLSPIDPVLSELWVRTKTGGDEINRVIPERALLLDKYATVRARGSLTRILAQWRNETTIASEAVAILGGLTLLLAAMGVFGVMAHAVVQRTHEIGVRMALGADRSAVVRLILSDGLRLAGRGVVIGALGCAVISWSARALLYGLSPLDPITFAGVSLLLCGVALLACWLPARQATKVEPVIALRYE